MQRNRLKMLVEIAIFAALALIIDLFIPSIGHTIKFSFKMLPIVVLALRWGMPAGLTGGFLWGLLQIVVGEAYILSVVQVFIEYIIAFTVIGLAGIMFKPIQSELSKENYSVARTGFYASLATIIGAFIRYVFHYIAGIVFWGEYAPEGQAASLYSLLVNGPAFLTEIITCIVIIWLLAPFYKIILFNKSNLK